MAVHAIVWRFVIDPAHRETFEREYGPDGQWAILFREGEGYLGTELFRSAASPDEYLTIDRWESEEAFLRFQREHGARYAAIDRALEKFTRLEERIGVIETRSTEHGTRDRSERELSG